MFLEKPSLRDLLSLIAVPALKLKRRAILEYPIGIMIRNPSGIGLAICRIADC